MSEEKAGKHRWIWWAVIGLGGLCLLLPPLLYSLYNRARFDQKVSELAAAGYPVSIDDLKAACVLPAGVENAANVYLKAFAAYVEPNRAIQEWLSVSGNYESSEEEPPYPPQVIEAIKTKLDRNRVCLELLDRAASMEYCLFARDWDRLVYFDNHLGFIRKAAQILTERNLYLAQTGRTDALFESTQTSVRLTDSLSRQPLHIDHLIIMAVKGLITRSLEESLNLTEFSDEQLAALQRDFGRMRENHTHTAARINERAAMIRYNRMSASTLMREFGVSAPLNRLAFLLYWFSGFKEKDAVLLLGVYERQIRVSQLPLHQQFPEIQAIRKDVESYPRFHFGLHQFGFTRRIDEINLRILSGLQCAETALAVERYRLKYRSLPPSLEAMVPEFMDAVPIDPFDGRPIRYLLREGGGYTLYSIGEDGVDNGGIDMRHARKTGGAGGYDWPFTVKR